MIPQWHFTEIPPNVRIREPQIEKFFSSDAVVDRAEALIREGIQNSLDAMTGTQLRIRAGTMNRITSPFRATSLRSGPILMLAGAKSLRMFRLKASVISGS